MGKNETLIIIALIIAVVALGLSIYFIYSLNSVNKKIEEMENAITEIKSVIERVEPYLPQIKILDRVLPRLQKLLIGVPPEEPPPETD